MIAWILIWILFNFVDWWMKKGRSIHWMMLSKQNVSLWNVLNPKLPFLYFALLKYFVFTQFNWEWLWYDIIFIYLSAWRYFQIKIKWPTMSKKGSKSISLVNFQLVQWKITIEQITESRSSVSSAISPLF